MALLAGKVVCITGASRGIGRACASESAKHGAAGLILHYLGDSETTREAQELQGTIMSEHSQCRVVIVAGDIADPKTSTQVSEYDAMNGRKKWLTRTFADCSSRSNSIWSNRYVAIHSELRQPADQDPDVLVSNAGICPFAEFLTMPHATWERTRQVNLDGSFYVTQGMHFISSWRLSLLSFERTLIPQRLQTK